MAALASRFGRFVLDRSGYRLLRDSEPIRLSPQLLDLLLHLVDRAGALVTKEELLDALWPNANVTENALTQAVSELRQALGDSASAPQFIKTITRRGYRFIGAIDPENASPGNVVERSSMAEEESKTPTIAVLDFVNVTGDTDSDWLSAGIAETVTGDLRARGHVRVVDRMQVTDAARRCDGSVQQIAQDVQAQLVVAGSIQRHGLHIRITARIVDVRTGEAVADTKVGGPFERIFELQDQIVIQLLTNLGVVVPRAEGSSVGRRDTQASRPTERRSKTGFVLKPSMSESCPQMHSKCFRDFSGKRFYGGIPTDVTWRPATSIPLADTDGNPETTSDLGWPFRSAQWRDWRRHVRGTPSRCCQAGQNLRAAAPPRNPRNVAGGSARSGRRNRTVAACRATTALRANRGWTSVAIVVELFFVGIRIDVRRDTSRLYSRTSRR